MNDFERRNFVNYNDSCIFKYADNGKILIAYDIILKNREGNYTIYQLNPIKENNLEEKELPNDDFKTKVTVFQHFIKGWFLDGADELCRSINEYDKNDEKKDQNKYIVLMIATAMIEKIGHFCLGDKMDGKNSKNAFLVGLDNIFSNMSLNNTELNTIYASLRCGLFHNIIQGKGVIVTTNDQFECINKGNDPTDKNIYIHPYKFYSKVSEYIDNYIEKLNDPKNISDRKKFDKSFLLYPGNITL